MIQKRGRGAKAEIFVYVESANEKLHDRRSESTAMYNQHEEDDRKPLVNEQDKIKTLCPKRTCDIKKICVRDFWV